MSQLAVPTPDRAGGGGSRAGGHYAQCNLVTYVEGRGVASLVGTQQLRLHQVRQGQGGLPAAARPWSGRGPEGRVAPGLEVSGGRRRQRGPREPPQAILSRGSIVISHEPLVATLTAHVCWTASSLGTPLRQRGRHSPASTDRSAPPRRRCCYVGPRAGSPLGQGCRAALERSTALRGDPTLGASTAARSGSRIVSIPLRHLRPRRQRGRTRGVGEEGPPDTLRLGSGEVEVGDDEADWSRP